MIVVEKDKDGKIIAYAEYQVLNQFGLQDEVGEYVFVNEIFRHKSCKKSLKELMSRFLIKELTKRPQLKVKWIYFQKEKHEKVRMYDLRRFL